MAVDGGDVAKIAEAYDSPSWWYDIRGFGVLTFSYNNSLWRQVKFFGAHFGPRHLEIACGSGTLLDLVLRYRRLRRMPVVEIVGVDYAPSMLAGAQKRFRNRSDVRLELCDAARLPFADASFDSLAIANALHSIPDAPGAVSESFRVLKPGGLHAANVLLHPRSIWPLSAIARRINRWGTKKGILHKVYDVEEAKALYVAAGFELVKAEISGNCIYLLAKRPN
ncbi:MAG: class I SAM-dependent methyltransferase [Acidimicrobiia bacterium]